MLLDYYEWWGHLGRTAYLGPSNYLEGKGCLGGLPT